MRFISRNFSGTVFLIALIQTSRFKSICEAITPIRTTFTALAEPAETARESASRFVVFAPALLIASSTPSG